MLGGDAKSAFMQGGADPKKGAEGDLYMSQPRNGKLRGLVKGQLLRLVGSAYGKVNAPRLWWRVIIGFLVTSGWTRHSMDASVLMYYTTAGVLVGILGIHVDDIIGGCADESVIQPLRDRIKWGSFTFGAEALTFCGRRVTRKQDLLTVTMRDHNVAIEVNKLPRDRRATPSAALEGGEPGELISGVGTLQWVGGN